MKMFKNKTQIRHLASEDFSASHFFKLTGNNETERNLNMRWAPEKPTFGHL